MASGEPYVLCGDFNAWPGSPAHQLTQDGYPSDSSMAALEQIKKVPLPDDDTVSAAAWWLLLKAQLCLQKSEALVKLWWKGFQHTSSSLKSAYASVLVSSALFYAREITLDLCRCCCLCVKGEEPLTTRTSQARRLDYIWLSAKIGLQGVLRPCLSGEQLLQLPSRLPTAAVPSDHLSLKADLILL